MKDEARARAKLVAILAEGVPLSIDTGTVISAWWVRHGMNGDAACRAVSAAARAIQWQVCPRPKRSTR